MAQTSKNSKIINFTAEAIYQAFASPQALEVWQAPGELTAKVYNFDLVKIENRQKKVQNDKQ